MNNTEYRAILIADLLDAQVEDAIEVTGDLRQIHLSADDEVWAIISIKARGVEVCTERGVAGFGWRFPLTETADEIERKLELLRP